MPPLYLPLREPGIDWSFIGGWDGILSHYHHESALTWSGVGVGGLGGLEAGVGEAGGPQHPGAGMVRAQRPREVSS